jgi:hypothetical protein
VRCSRNRLETLLHPEFREFGRSGAEYTRAQIIEHLLSETNAARVHAQGFAILGLAPSVVRRARTRGKGIHGRRYRT